MLVLLRFWHAFHALQLVGELVWAQFESEHCVCLTLLLTVIRDTSTPLLWGVESVLGKSACLIICRIDEIYFTVIIIGIE